MDTNAPIMATGAGRSNVDPATGIHYGVIHPQAFSAWAMEHWLQPDYGTARCPECATPLQRLDDYIHHLTDDTLPEDTTLNGTDFWCEPCQQTWSPDLSFPEEPLRWVHQSPTLELEGGTDGFGFFITKSPVYTYTEPCSPCAPGAGDLQAPHEAPDGLRTYCLPLDWFDDLAPCPYAIYDLATDHCLYRPDAQAPDEEA